MLAALQALALGCAPAADGRGDGADASAGPSALLVAPPPGREAPTNLVRVVIVWPGPAPAGVTIRNAADGAMVDALARVPAPGDPACVGRAPGSCLALELLERLAPDAEYLVGPLRFRTASGPDEQPPAASVVVDEADGCAVARIRCDEPCWAELILSPVALGAERRAVATLADEPEAAWSFADDAAARPGDAFEVSVIVTDLAGNERLLFVDREVLAAASPGWMISEVLANPSGPEPEQEWIEVVRRADTPGSLAGLRISDGAGWDELPDVTVPAGGRALIVPAGFEASAAPGALLVRLAGPTIGHNGLANRGETMTLLAGVTRLSMFTARFDVSSPSWSGRSVERTGVCDLPAAAVPAAPSPGW